MKSFDQADANLKKNIRYVLADIDDTLTTNGKMTSAAFAAGKMTARMTRMPARSIFARTPATPSLKHVRTSGSTL